MHQFKRRNNFDKSKTLKLGIDLFLFFHLFFSLNFGCFPLPFSFTVTSFQMPSLWISRPVLCFSHCFFLPSSPITLHPAKDMVGLLCRVSGLISRILSLEKILLPSSSLSWIFVFPLTLLFCPRFSHFLVSLSSSLLSFYRPHLSLHWSSHSYFLHIALSLNVRISHNAFDKLKHKRSFV